MFVNFYKRVPALARYFGNNNTDVNANKNSGKAPVYYRRFHQLRNEKVKYWIEEGNGLKDWNEYQCVLEQAYLHDKWLNKVYTDKKDIMKYLTRELPALYETLMRDGNGGFAVIKSRTGNLESGTDRIIGGTCISYGIPPTSNKDSDWKEMSLPNRREYINARIITEPIQELCKQHDIELWYGFKQAVLPELQRRRIGSEIIPLGQETLVKNEMKRRGFLHPVFVYCYAFDEHVAKIMLKSGYHVVGKVEFCMTGVGSVSNYALLSPIGGDVATSKVKNIILEARRMFNYVDIEL